MSSAGPEKVFESIGGFGKFQVKFYLLFGYVVVLVSAVLMVMTFSTAEPPWRCAANSSQCTLNGTFKIGDEHYDYRCKLPRKDWQFAVDGKFDSIVTEVKHLIAFIVCEVYKNYITIIIKLWI